MGLFSSKEEKEEKKAQKEAKLLAKYGLDDLEGKDLESVKIIANELVGNKWLETGALFSGAKAEDLVKMTTLTTLVEQNWIIIRMLNRISNQLKESNS